MNSKDSKKNILTVSFLEKYINKLKYEDFWEFMNKTLIISALSIFIILLISPLTAYAQNLDVTNQEITLTTQNNENIKIEELIILQSNTNESIYNLDFWIQKGANNIVILVNGNEYTYINDETDYSINISSLEIKIGDQITVKISYILNKNTQNFEKKLYHNTNSFKVTFDSKMLFSSINIAKESQLSIPLYKTIETPDETPIVYYIIILILLIIIIVIFIYSTRRRKPSKINEIINVTEEVLTTKKSLLMSLLKDLEKQYRAKEISDDTYHKLKEQYKQETVDTMKRLDDMTKSKV